MTQSQSKIHSITFSHQLLRLFSQNQGFKQILQKFFINKKKNDSFIITATSKEEIFQDHISKHLATICDLPFSTGIFPTILKRAKVIPIHKKDSKLEVSNCRSISLLSSINKISNKLITVDSLNFLRKDKFFITNSVPFQKISQPTMPFSICQRSFRKH